MAITGPLAEMLERNKKFAESHKGSPTLLQMSKAAHDRGDGVMVITCSDPRLNPYEILGLDETVRAVIIRNAGGRTFDVLRSLAVLDTIGKPATIVVMHHSDCGMTHFHDDAVKKAWLDRNTDAEARKMIEETKYGEMLGPIEESIKEDVTLLRNSPFIREGVQVVGLKYDVFNGKLEEVEV